MVHRKELSMTPLRRVTKLVLSLMTLLAPHLQWAELLMRHRIPFIRHFCGHNEVRNTLCECKERTGHAALLLARQTSRDHGAISQGQG